MHYYEVAPNRIVRADSVSFTYSYEKPLTKGQIVLVEAGNKRLIGLVLKQVQEPGFKTKPILSLIEKRPLPSQLVDLAFWISDYYATPLATVLQTILPSGIQKSRRLPSKQIKITERIRTKIVFNNEQLKAIDALDKYDAGTFLLHGVTGSGKTEIYIEAAKNTVREGRSVIILVPEIALTSQIISEFSNHFDDLLVTHSSMTESSRHLVWQEVLNSEKPRIVIGPRSALFSPLKSIGLIIIDEAHEPSLKQEQSPRYSALRAATILGRSHKAKVIFGSATPSVVDRYLAKKSDRPILKLTKPAKINSVKPEIILVDMKKPKNMNFNKHRFLSDQLLEQIESSLNVGKQTLIFHNRRGSTAMTICKDCGWSAECPNCFLPLTLHIDRHLLSCHVCGYGAEIPTACPSCGSSDVIHKGIGTKLIETELKKLFPEANIARFDSDNANDETLNARYQDLYDGKIDIVVGTQVVAKGLDLPDLRTVGVIQADSGLCLPDYGSNERTFQLLTQVIGRVGRNQRKSYVVIQTYQPDHLSISSGLDQNYEYFYEQTLKERKMGLFPPFTYLLKLTCSYKTEAAVIKNAKKLAGELKTKIDKDVRILGPTPAFYERQFGNFRWQLILKSPKREHLTDIIKHVPSAHWQFELDPTSLL